ncbi:exocyst complex component 3 [Nelusetta ayraudi]|uniref:exocyst complex component 3 n=1 Tax=Nelusetta ayraudi TaxID=303726 RepID=UPI003F6E4C25
MKKWWSVRKPGRTSEHERTVSLDTGYRRLAPNDDSPPDEVLTTTSHQEGRCPTGEEVTLQELAGYLGVSLAGTTESDSGCSVQPEANSDQRAEIIIQRSVEELFPKAPADLQKNLQQHMLNIQETVVEELLRVAPLLNGLGLMGRLIGCYHRKTFGHLDTLLQGSRSTQNSFVLLNWVLHTYFSQELLCHPELQEMDLIKDVDMLIFTEWVSKAKDELLQRVKREMEIGLENTLQCDRSNENSQHDEACAGLYVDIIQLTESFLKETQKINFKLSADVQEVCFEEMLAFLTRFTTEQVDFLKTKATMDNPEMHHFLKTLKVCKELKQYVNTKANSATRSLVEKILATLENMEASTMKSLQECVAKLAESHFKIYFNRDNKQILTLMQRIQTIFPRTWLCEGTRMTVMNAVFKLLVHKYVKHLVKVRQAKLMKLWTDVGQTLRDDAMLLRNVMKDLALPAEESSLVLKIEELLTCKNISLVILTVNDMLNNHLTLREDPDLLLALLRWKGLHRRDIEDVLNTCSCAERQPRPRHVSCFSLLSCLSVAVKEG